MPTIRAQLANLSSSSNPKKDSLIISKNIEDVDIDLFGFIYGLLTVFFLDENIDQDYVSLSVNKYKDDDNYYKMAIGFTFLEKLNDDSDVLASLNSTEEVLETIKNEIISLNLNYFFNDITVNDKQWRNNVK